MSFVTLAKIFGCEIPGTAGEVQATIIAAALGHLSCPLRHCRTDDLMAKVEDDILDQHGDSIWSSTIRIRAIQICSINGRSLMAANDVSSSNTTPVGGKSISAVPWSSLGSTRKIRRDPKPCLSPRIT